MNLKEYFKPDKRKIRTSFLLVLLYLFICTLILSSEIRILDPLFMNYYTMAIILDQMPFITILIVVLLTYCFACYISINKKWMIGVVLYLIVTGILPIVMEYSIDNWNNMIGLSCNNDSDCHCDSYQNIAVNNKFIQIDVWGGKMDCIGMSAVCEDGKCRIIMNYDDINYKRKLEAEYRIDISDVWNNSGKISFRLINTGLRQFSEEDVSQFHVYIDKIRKEISYDCINNLNDMDTSCQIDTDVDFPTILGEEGTVQINVTPPFGSGDVYICRLYSPERLYC